MTFKAKAPEVEAARYRTQNILEITRSRLLDSANEVKIDPCHLLSFQIGGKRFVLRQGQWFAREPGTDNYFILDHDEFCARYDVPPPPPHKKKSSALTNLTRANVHKTLHKVTT